MLFLFVRHVQISPGSAVEMCLRDSTRCVNEDGDVLPQRAITRTSRMSIKYSHNGEKHARPTLLVTKDLDIHSPIKSVERYRIELSPLNLDTSSSIRSENSAVYDVLFT